MVDVIKRDGTRVPFEKKRLKQSLSNAGASKKVIEEIANTIDTQLKEGDTTDFIYKKAFSMLGEREKTTATRYSLRSSIFSYGPTGFPFEKFIGRLFERKGYSVEFNKEIKGRCVSHEVDVLAKGTKGDIAMEVKFQSRTDLRIDLKTALYVHSRFRDLKSAKRVFFPSTRNRKCILITNSKFTSRAIQYAECSGMDMIGWGYPKNNGIEKVIEQAGAHPITCLPTLTTKLAKVFFENNIIICADLKNTNQDKLISMVRDGDTADMLREEAVKICV